MFDDATRQQQYGLVGAAVLLTAVGFGAGIMYSGGTPTGDIAAGDDLAEEEIRQQVQQLMNQQMQAQQQQLQMMAQQSEDLSVEDLSMDASVTDVSASQFDGLYEVTVTVEGQVPGQQGELQQIDQDQTFLISHDGRYLFQEPTDLEAQPQQPPAGGQ